MGNNNTFLANDRNPSDAIIWPKDVKKAMSEIAKISIITCSPNPSTSEIHTGEVSLEHTNLCHPISSNQRIFLNNVILPVANAIISNLQQKQISGKTNELSAEKSIAIPEKNPLELPRGLDSSMFSSSPESSSMINSRNVEAIILKNYSSEDHKEYPAVFRYNGNAKEVFVTGSFNNWSKQKMYKSKGATSFLAIMDLKEGILRK